MGGDFVFTIPQEERLLSFASLLVKWLDYLSPANDFKIGKRHTIKNLFSALRVFLKVRVSR